MKRLWEKAITSSGANRFFYSPLLFFLSVIAVPYQYFSRRRLAARRQTCSKEWQANVISVGNLTVGGSGKTPVTIYLAGRFAEQDKKVAVVHSGYGRRDTREYLIEPGKISEYTVEQIGDEVAMMGAALPDAGFAIGSDKKCMLKLADEKFHPDIILIDDGYQRLDIEKDLDTLLLPTDILAQTAGDRPLTTCRLFPRGILREPLAAISRADLVFVIREDAAEKNFKILIEGYKPGAKVISWTMAITGIEIDGHIEALAALKTRRPLVFASIGSYDRMLRMLNQSGIPVAYNWNFGDHHTYTDKDFHRLRKMAAHYSADCYLTTAKDMVKLPPKALDKPIYCLRLDLQPDDRERLSDTVDLKES